jgi:signal transduction histidine kinase
MQEGQDYFHPRRAERAIAVARLLLAPFTFLAFPLNSQQAGPNTSWVGLLALVYLMYAVCAVLLICVRPKLPTGLPEAAHVIDLSFFPLFLYLSGDATGPSVIYFTSVVTSGAIRWRARGALITGVAGLGTYVGLMLADAADPDGNFQTGRFLSDCAQFSIVTVVVAYVGRLLGAALDRPAQLVWMMDEAVRHERLRLARDLHDGVLQALTGLALQAARLGKVMQGEPVKAHSELGELQEALLAEQRAVRSMVEELKRDPTIGGIELDLAGRLREVATRVGAQWGVRIDLELARNGPPLPQQLARDICHIAEESLVNAIRHGAAKDVRLQWRVAEDSVNLRVAYAGRGFTTFRGRHDLDSLNRMHAGPGSLKERVSELRGTLVINSGDDGATVEIAVPLTSDAQRSDTQA